MIISNNKHDIMAVDTATYLVSLGIATRSGLLNSRYRTADNKYILDRKDLSRVRLTAEEYLTGLKGVEMIDLVTAKKLIKENGYQMGMPEDAPITHSFDHDSEYQQQTDAISNSNTDDTNANDSVDTEENVEQEAEEVVTGEDIEEEKHLDEANKEMATETEEGE